MGLVQKLFCPSCGAPVHASAGASTTCEFCGSSLVVGRMRISQSPKKEAPLPTEAPPATLFSQELERFELSVLEQLGSDVIDDGFFQLTLDEGRFCLCFVRVSDLDGKSLTHDYPALCQLLRDSLGQNEDPGLAAYDALEDLSNKLSDFKLEISISMFSPEHCSVVVYSAGSNRSLYWVSGEEGRVIDKFRSYPALERKMLRMSSDHFSNCDQVYLSASDLIVGVSAAYAGRGGGAYSDGTGALVKSLNKNLGEPALKIVTLAKNAFWNGRPPAAAESPLSGHLRVAAVRALQPKPATAPLETNIELLRGASFELALQAEEGDFFELLPLHDQREVLLWFNGNDFKPEEYELAKTSILALLDRPNYGDNENPRRAGREACSELGHGGRHLILLCLNKHTRFKWYREGWKQAIPLGARGLSSPPSAQIFDEGGEASLGAGERLFFAGSLATDKLVQKATELAHNWPGGKASALYETLFSHWRTKKPQVLLSKILEATQKDNPESSSDGCLLLSLK